MTRRERLLRTLRGETVDRPAVGFYEIGLFAYDPDDPDPYNVHNDPSWRGLIDVAEGRTDLIRGVGALAALPVMGQFGWVSSTGILYLLLAAALLRSITDSIGWAGWFPMLQDNVPSRITGKFFGTFRMYWQTGVLIVSLLIAWFLGKDPAWWKFCVVFGVGEACFVVKIFFLKQSPDQAC